MQKWRNKWKDYKMGEIIDLLDRTNSQRDFFYQLPLPQIQSATSTCGTNLWALVGHRWSKTAQYPHPYYTKASCKFIHTLIHKHVHAYLSLMQFVQQDLRRPGKPDVDGHKSE